MKIPRLISASRPEIPPAARFGTGLELNYELTVMRKAMSLRHSMAASPYADRIAIETMRDWQLNRQCVITHLCQQICRSV